MNTRSIRFRLVVWYAGLLVAVFVLLGGLIYGGLKLYLEQSLAQSQIRRARQIAETLLANIATTGEAHVIDEINSWFAPQTNDRFIRITREDGTTLYRSSNPRDGRFDVNAVPAYAETAEKKFWRKQTLPGDKDLLIATIPCLAGNGKHYLVEVGASLESVKDVLHRLVVLLVLGLAGMVVVAIGSGYFLVTRALAPVDELSSTARRITLNNLKERLPAVNTGDELERLTISLNHMIARLDDALEYNRRFIADASHELRTPLTILRGELESVVEQSGQSQEMQSKMASVLEEVERLARIVEGLFALSRLDAGEAQKESTPFDLGELAVSTAEQMCLLAEDKDITITANAPGKVIVKGDRARVKQVVVNLLDNAVKYTQPGGKVNLRVSQDDGNALLEVSDNGVGIPLEAQTHIFERFFRVEPARSRESGGAGLGLSIVKSICAAHGGNVSVQSAEGSGSCFKVELPLAQ